MKKYFFALCLLTASAVSMASGGSVVGNGGFRDPMEGVATFAMDVQEDNLKNAFFVFASEGNHHGPDYPDAVFRSVVVQEYYNSGGTVMIEGHGLLYGQIPVSYRAVFRDAGPQRGDHFELHCWMERTNHLVHFAHFLTAGDIVVNPGK
jgi:hypothetical protein